MTIKPNNTSIHCLAAQNLSCERGRRELFSDVAFSLNSGQSLIVTGENGSGKTSLLKILTGLSLAAEGAVLWDQQDIHHQAQSYQQQLLYIGHRAAVKTELTVRENLQLLLKLWPNELAMSIPELADCVGLRKRLSVQCGRLSAGQQRRVALARLFVAQQKLWILDEPLTALDVGFIEAIEQQLGRHLDNQGLLVLTTHRGIEIDPAKLIKLELSR